MAKENFEMKYQDYPITLTPLMIDYLLPHRDAFDLYALLVMGVKSKQYTQYDSLCRVWVEEEGSEEKGKARFYKARDKLVELGLLYLNKDEKYPHNIMFGERYSYTVHSIFPVEGHMILRTREYDRLNILLMEVCRPVDAQEIQAFKEWKMALEIREERIQMRIKEQAVLEKEHAKN